MSTETPSEPKSKEEYPAVDHFLSALVHTANQAPKGGFGIGITVFVGGTVISGILTGVDDYWQYVGQEMNHGFARSGFPDVGERMQKAFTDVAALPVADTPVHIHLKNATIYLGNAAFSTNVWWRGRLTAIDGFILGNATEQ